MNSYTQLQNQAIQAAQRGEWDQAAAINESMIAQQPSDVKALNRLAIAYVQLGKRNEAKEIFSQVLSIDSSNTIAKKNSARLSKNEEVKVPTLGKENFIEEPGKTKTVELKRLAGKKVLKQITIGQVCQLKPKNRYISIEVEGEYLGALPEDLSFRLSKLIDSGNEYQCRIRSISEDTCNISVFLKESKRSKENQTVNSFPIAKSSNQLSLASLDESIDFADEVPLIIVDTDEDEDEEQQSRLSEIREIAASERD